MTRSGPLAGPTFDSLDDGCILHIFSFLVPMPDRFQAGRVCQRWRQLSGDRRLWLHVDPRLFTSHTPAPGEHPSRLRHQRGSRVSLHMEPGQGSGDRPSGGATAEDSAGVHGQWESAEGWKCASPCQAPWPSAHSLGPFESDECGGQALGLPQGQRAPTGGWSPRKETASGISRGESPPLAKGFGGLWASPHRGSSHSRAVFPTIAAAVAAALPGDTVLVASGVEHKASDLTIDKPLCLRGSGASEHDTVISCGRGANSALVFEASAHLTNLTVRSQRSNCVVHLAGCLLVQRCSLECVPHPLDHLFAPIVSRPQLPCKAKRSGTAPSAQQLLLVPSPCPRAEQVPAEPGGPSQALQEEQEEDPERLEELLETLWEQGGPSSKQQRFNEGLAGQEALPLQGCRRQPWQLRECDEALQRDTRTPTSLEDGEGSSVAPRGFGKRSRETGTVKGNEILLRETALGEAGQRLLAPGAPPPHGLRVVETCISGGARAVVTAKDVVLQEVRVMYARAALIFWFSASRAISC